ncbi:MAG: CsgG/HfaB family protein [Candidatus Bipolaricaulota bacterium]|nr:CsgG/HfaB family protein [Candidatus Bipolaricaulota bacterium]
MKRLIAFVSLSIALFVSVLGMASPDLIVASINLSPENPVVGQMVTITATVENIGTTDAQNRFNVRFLVDEIQVDTPSIPFGIDAGRNKSISINWQPSPGMHTIIVEADQPFNRISESNEENNSQRITLAVSIDPATSALSNIKVAVARFEDRSSSGFINVGQGIADELVGRLVQSGVRVLERSDLEAVMQERGLNPAITSDLVTAGQLLGADLLIVGSVTKANVQQQAISLGFFSASSASVDIAMSARLVSVYTSEIVDAVSAEGSASGSTGFSVDIGKLLSTSQPAAANVCSGGLRSDKPYYYIGETAHFGYKNSGLADWFNVEIDTIGGVFIKMLDSGQFVGNGACGEWFWDQRGPGGVQLSPGLYIAKLWDGMSYIATVSFQIKPGMGAVTPLSEITVGSGQFDETIVGKATNSALDQLVSRLITGMENAAPDVLAARESSTARTPAIVVSREGQVAAILSDGRIAINIGADAGVHKGDFFQVLETINLVVDPVTGEILSYDVVGVRGEIVITDVRDRVSYAVPTSDFDLLIGDIVRPESQ